MNLQNKMKLEGQLRDISDEGLTIQGPGANGKIGSALVKFKELKSLSVNGKPSKKAKLPGAF